jgi:superfamily II DNA or RNA helicase
LWAIQAKFRRQPHQALSRRSLGTFTALAFNTCRNIRLAVIAHTCAKPVSKSHLMRDTVEIGLERWQYANWELIRARVEGKKALPIQRRPQEHQQRALDKAKEHFIRGNAARGRLIMPCGTGKSLLAFWIANDTLKAKKIVVAAPSLALMRQTLTEWTRELLARGQDPNSLDWLCVCSDESVGQLERDEIVGDVYDSGLPTHTDPQRIAERLCESSETKIVFTTYHSSATLAAAAQRAKVAFDLIIFDEAHRTAGASTNPFATLLPDEALEARYRLFMTATERKIDGAVDVYSMDEHEDIYGKRFFTMTYKEAIEAGIISDYKILTVVVSDEEITSYIDENRLLDLHRDLHEAEARAIATGIALKKMVRQHGITHALSFHSSIKAADNFREQQDVLNCLQPTTENFHISSKKTAGQRKQLLDQFRASPRTLMTNARCLMEGVDVPAIDCVVFADPRQSVTDIVQASGRAMRRSHGKPYGYILVPVVVPTGMSFEEFAETTALRTVMRIITALSIHDERIVHELRAIHNGRLSKGTIIEIDGTVPVGMQISLDRFADAISTKIWESVARVNWRPFEEARAFVQSLKLKNHKGWVAYVKSGEKPADVPAKPHEVYANTGWLNWADWLGNGKRTDTWRPFAEARAFVRSLKLKGQKEWHAYIKSEEKPADIPVTPWAVYANTGWLNWPDWLGNGIPRSNWRPFEEARAFARSLGLKNAKEWRAYAKSGQKPADVPANAHVVYANTGWLNFSDWLGNGRNGHGPWRPFAEARAYVQSLKLKSTTEWYAYRKSGDRPKDIPANPNTVYANTGWLNWPDWLATDRYVGDRRRFEEARAFVRSLKLKSSTEWYAYRKSGDRPKDIPSNPNAVYPNDWVSLPDWLGTGKNERWKGAWRRFEEARAFVRSLKLKSTTEWCAYRKSGNKPADIPTHPDGTYSSEWAGWPDWLGTGKNEKWKGAWRRFEEARAFVRSLKLKSTTEWCAYRKSGDRPRDIPSNPKAGYPNDWVSWPDWLGTTG